RSFESGHQLALHADSTYREQSCGNIDEGKWSHQGDSVILFCSTTWYRAVKWHLDHVDRNYDSIAGIHSNLRTAFFIEKNKLIKIDTGRMFIIRPDGSKKFLNGYCMTLLRPE